MKIKLIVLSLIIDAFTVAHAQSVAKAPYQDAIGIAKDSVSKLMKKGMIPGLSITVAVNNEIVWSEGFGYADLEQQVPVHPGKTKFRIGSISKSMTAAGLARLIDKGKIILDSSIYFYLPDYPRYRYRPTVRQLAGHTAGIRHYKGNEFFIAKRYAKISEALSIFNKDTLMFKPGTKYLYTSHGYVLLGAIIEKASKKKFLKFLQQEVFTPLKLENTIADMNDSIIDFRTRFYVYKNNKWRNAPPVDNSYKWASGGLISTSEDVARFANSMLIGDFIKKETLTLLRTPQVLADGMATRYGIGFTIEKDKLGTSYFGHSGGSVGGSSNMVIYPESKVVVVILTNLSDASLGGEAQAIAHLFMR
ncbi:MAG: serine hydrolase domain-containing protein [Bacteroidota bacterium]